MLFASLSAHLLVLPEQQAHFVHGGKVGIPLELTLSNFSSVQVTPSATPQSVIHPKPDSTHVTKPTKPARPEVRRQGRDIVPKRGQALAPKALQTAQHQINKPDSVKKTALSKEKEIKPSSSKIIEKPTKKNTLSTTQSGQLGTKSNPVVNTAPKFKSRPVAPIYPDSAKRFGREGEVIVSIELDDKGNKTRISIIHSSGYHSLDRAALAAVDKWQFVAYKKNDRPVASQVTIPIRFSLGN
ncbi:energy transducer TonB [Vibrio hepatarius]|uniref:energy transducer TonB n=1 Tax=Vibrio hepatarius TaxID=171383 RepID=UPI001C090B5E|nr:energy transducer TonB [Vibrio hepatarius]MBU2895732.1 energy transducer TonB [Vibrio hepatarius]